MLTAGNISTFWKQAKFKIHRFYISANPWCSVFSEIVYNCVLLMLEKRQMLSDKVDLWMDKKGQSFTIQLYFIFMPGIVSLESENVP